MKKATRIFALVMALAMLLSLSALASGEPSGAPAPAGDEFAPFESVEDMTPSSYGSLDNFRRDDSGFVYVGYDIVDGQLTGEGNWTGDPANIVLANIVEGEGFTAVHADGEASRANVSGILILSDEGEGTHASDFSGVGAAIVGANGAAINVKDAIVITDGFVRAGLILDNYARAWVKDSVFLTYGANPLTEAWDGYFNSANTGMMLSPPWVLGIQGGIRTMNVLDNYATLVIEDSALASGGWGVVSTDGCTKPVIYVIDSELGILPESEGGMNSGWELFGYDEDAYGSGYGSYVIGNATENFYGAAITGATFGAIAREGSAVYASSNGAISVNAADDGSLIGTVQGDGQPSVINAVFGNQVHQNEDTSVAYLDGTVVNAEQAVCLYRSSGHTSYTADNAQLNAASGIILQMMDDDDMLVGGFSPFNEFFYETEGVPSKNGSLTGEAAYNSECSFDLSNGVYNGNFYNGTGYYGGQAGDVMNITIGEGAAVNGAISLTETFHGMPYRPEAVQVLNGLGGDVAYVFLDAAGNICDEANAAFIQFTQFSIRQYYMLCHVANLPYNNGFSGANVTVSNGGVWKVTDTSIINYLKIDGGTVYGTLAQNPDGSLTLTPGAAPIPAGEYGTKVEANVAAASGMGNAGSGEPSGSDEASGEPASDEPSGEPAAAGGSVEDAYVEYIHEWLLNELENNSNMTIEQVEDEFMPLIEAGDYVSFPAEMLWNGMLNTGSPMTFEEFAAQY